MAWIDRCDLLLFRKAFRNYYHEVKKKRKENCLYLPIYFIWKQNEEKKKNQKKTHTAETHTLTHTEDAWVDDSSRCKIIY